MKSLSMGLLAVLCTRAMTASCLAHTETTLPKDRTDLGSDFSAYVLSMEKEVRDVTAFTKADPPQSVNQFFTAVKSREWSEAGQIVTAFRQRFYNRLDDDGKSRSADSLFLSVMGEVECGYLAAGQWESDLVELFSSESLAVIPDGSIVFSSSAPARAIICVAMAKARPAVTVICNVVLAGDNVYAHYLRCVHGKRVAFFTADDASKAQGDALQAAYKEGHRQTPRTFLAASAVLARRVFNDNKLKHDFYVEEGFPVPWMYEYALPAGLLLRLNTEPVATLTGEAVKRDHDYWNGLEKRLGTTTSFSANKSAKTTFSRCRAAIGALYAFHKMWPEAEWAFQQALRIYPDSPQANLRLAEMYEAQGRITEAVSLMAAYVKRAFPTPRAKEDGFLDLLPYSRSDIEAYLAALKARESRTSTANQPSDRTR